jgi:hydrogenase maturation protease
VEPLTPDATAEVDLLLGAGASLGGSQLTGGVLIGGIGLPWLRDLDFGTSWLARAAELDWSDDVILEDLSYSAHRVMHRLEELRPRKVVLVGCMPRGTDPAGSIRRYRLPTEPPDPVEVHERLTEAVGGIIDLDHTLFVCRHWKALPDDTTVIEVEPEDREFGMGFSPKVDEAVATVLEMVREEVAGA